MDRFTKFMLFIMAVNTCHRESIGGILLICYISIHLANELCDYNTTGRIYVVNNENDK